MTDSISSTGWVAGQSAEERVKETRDAITDAIMVFDELLGRIEEYEKAA